MGKLQRFKMLLKMLRFMPVMMKMLMLVTWVVLMLMRMLMLCHPLLLQFIPCSHSGSLLLDTLILILLIFSSP
jgi:hypothetical protein